LANITGTIKTYANESSYTIYNPHTIDGSLSDDRVEIQFILHDQTLIALDVFPASNSNWPTNSDFTFDAGYLRGAGGTGNPDQFGTVSGSTNTFVAISGSTLTVGNSYSGTRTSATIYPDAAVTGPEYICVRCINNESTAGTILTATMWLRDNTSS
jgi:hypothetical protein